MKNWFLGACALGGLLLSCSESWAFGWCCPSYCAPAPCVTYQHVQVQRTICVPKYHTEQRHYTVCEYTTEARVQKVQRHRCVPIVKDVPYDYYVSVPVQQVQKQTYYVNVPYTEKVEQAYTVMVPKTVKYTATRKLCRTVPVVTKATRCVDHGCFVDQVYNYTVCCGWGGCCCAPCYQTVCATQKVWQPNLVHEQYDVTSYTCEYYDEPYTYDVTVCEPVVQKQLVDVQRCKTEARVRDVTYTVYNQEKRTAVRKVTEYTTEAYEDTVTYHVSVPVHTQRTYEVQVCTYEHQVITETVCVPCYSGCNTGCYSGSCCGW